MNHILVSCENLVKIFKATNIEVVALQGLDLEIMSGEILGIVGASGSGKSTLLNILGGLDEPTAGTCTVDGHDLMRMNEYQRTLYRSNVVGFLWQQSSRNLRPELTIQANVELPQIISGVPGKRRKQRSLELLDLIGIRDLARKKPHQLSGGQQQRAALAVALANKPALLLADEPTGSLDSATAHEIMMFMRHLNQTLGLTIVIVTHDATIASSVDRTIAIRDGRTSSETLRREAPLALSDQHTRQSSVIGLTHQTHRESIVIDRVGRLQLPKEIMEKVEFQGRAEVELIEDHVELRPVQVK